MYREEGYLLISGIQHFVFCKRQWSLIHMEGLWWDNIFTTMGNLLHQRAHNEKLTEKRGSTIVFRGMKINSHRLGITGECDVVEFKENTDGVSLHKHCGTYLPFPVEYKKGAPKIDDCDRLQLCAQAVCLEEMLCCNINEGAIFYGEPKKRELITFSQDLRELLRETVNEMHHLFQRQQVIKAIPSKKCNACSLKDVCLPKLAKKTLKSVDDYLKEGLL